MADRPLSPHQTAPQGRTRLSQHCPDSCAPPFERRQVHLPDASLDTAETRITHCPWLLCARVAGVRGRLRHASRVCNVGPPDTGRCASSGASRRPAVPAHRHPRRALSSELPLGGWMNCSATSVRLWFVSHPGGCSQCATPVKRSPFGTLCKTDL